MTTAKKATCGFVAAAAMAALAALTIACGSGSAGTSPTPPPTPTPAPSGGTTITITSAGVSPATITVARGSQVTFVNNDTQNHDELSDPHPDHTDCPELNSVGFMAPGQSRQSQNLNTARTCGYHDHELFSDPRWQGKIIIQ
jgi:plastocyanin